MTVVQHFDAALRMTEYDAFVGRIAERVGLAGFLMTPDAAFGHERRGTPTTLAELGARIGFEVAVVPPFSLEGRPVRSRVIRDGDRRRRPGRGAPSPRSPDGASTGDLVDGTRDVPDAGRAAPRRQLPGDGRAGLDGRRPERDAAPERRHGRRRRVELLRPGGRNGPRVRVAFGARLPEEGNPAILRRSQKKTSK